MRMNNNTVLQTSHLGFVSLSVLVFELMFSNNSVQQYMVHEAARKNAWLASSLAVADQLALNAYILKTCLRHMFGLFLVER
jgi:hypothetical protein